MCKKIRMGLNKENSYGINYKLINKQAIDDYGICNIFEVEGSTPNKRDKNIMIPITQYLSLF